MSRKFEEIRDMLCEELDKIAEQGELSAGSLELVDKLTHSIKSIDTIMAMEYAGYSERGYSYNRDWRDGDMRGNSYARGDGRGRGQNARRDSRGRYSREGGYSYAEDFRGMLEEAMQSAPNEQAREKLRRMMNDM